MADAEIKFVEDMDALRNSHNELHKDKNREYCPFCRNIKLESSLTDLFDALATQELRQSLVIARDVLRIRKLSNDEEE